MYKCEYFKIYELVSEQTYKDRGEKGWQLFDQELLGFIDYLRSKFGRITVNDWKWGGSNQWRGLRTSDSQYYSKYSQHSFGRAFDLIFQDVTAEEVRRWLEDNVELWQRETGILSITCEEGVSWLHIDTRNNPNGYNSFNP